MRCILCKEKAVYGLLRFCKEHYLDYYEKKVRKYLKSTHTKNYKILIGVSGGKDSCAVADILNRLKDEYHLELELFIINLKIPGYSDEGVEAARELGKKLDLPVRVLDMNELPKQIPEFAFDKDGKPAKPCSQCGTIKRYLLNKEAVENGFDYVVTGHNLDDEYYFALHSLYGQDVRQILRGGKSLPPKKKEQMAGRLKPLYYLTEKENMLYCILRDLPVHNDECPYSKGNPQIAFKQQHSCVKRDQKANLLKSIRKMQGMIEEKQEKAGTILNLNKCPKCGFPTTRDDACIYCRLMETNKKAEEE